MIFIIPFSKCCTSRWWKERRGRCRERGVRLTGGRVAGAWGDARGAGGVGAQAGAGRSARRAPSGAYMSRIRSVRGGGLDAGAASPICGYSTINSALATLSASTKSLRGN
jgi:hypothetical protein